jgi:hypothetical protein
MIVILAGSFAVTAPSRAAAAAPLKADQIGMSGNAFPWEPHWNQFQTLMDESHTGWARVELRWDYIHPGPSDWNWGLYDDLVNGYAAKDMRQLGLLTYSVAWASGGTGGGVVFGPPSNWAAYEAYVTATVNRYKDRIHHWEVWNEPDAAFFWNGTDGGDPQGYLTLLQHAHKAIKAADPSAVVMNGGLTGTERGAKFMSKLLDMGAGPYLDAVAFHGYVSNDGLDTNVYPDIIWPMISQVRERAGKPLWITEYGWDNGCGGATSTCSEAGQANRLARHTAMLFKLGGVERIFIFQFKDPGNQPNSLGLARADATKKQAFTAVATIAERLAGLTYERRVDLGVPGVWAMRFSNAARTVDIVWSQAGDTQLFYPTGQRQIRTWRITGTREDKPAAQGGAWIQVTNDPLVVERDLQAPNAGGGGRCRYFPETHQSLCDGFLDFWERHGGLPIFGYPLSAEVAEDGRTVQYLERMKFEFHPEWVGGEWAVVGELMGRTITTGREGEASFGRIGDPQDAGAWYFGETGHTLRGAFRDYWTANGGLWMFGFPISEEFPEWNPDTGQVYTVQYFERARFEYHPENAGTPYVVLLGRLGAQLFDQRY